jgi:hypothetical protein
MKVVKEPAVSVWSLICDRAYVSSATIVMAPNSSISGEDSACKSTYLTLVFSSFRAASRNRRDSYCSAPNAFTTMCPLMVS